ncbi:E3 ubiquitin ligase [Kalmusia sp. IMI 367209]|nr:E3 ubiquitin ligase [Kalmusia sp. IMI 367209]
MPSASSKARGTTPTSSRSPAQAGESRPGRPASKDSLKQKMAMMAEEPPRPSKADEQLKALHSDFDSLRSHLTCKICDRLLYQPYTISCGHTYCYSCLCTWFVANKARKTCPDCRVVVTQLPAPGYVIRDMIAIFINRAELLPTGETIEQHAKWQKEEADAVQQDKENNDPRAGGLFKGCFKTTHARGPSLQVIRDQEDGVERCPVCSWELEDGECVQCGLFFDDNGELTWTDSFTGFSDMDEMSEQDMSGEDLDAEMDMDDADFDGYGGPAGGWPDYYPDESNFMMQRFLEHGMAPHAAFMQRRRPMSHSEAGSRRSYSQSIVSDLLTEEMDTVEEEDEDGLEEDSSMNDFIDDDEDQSSASAGASSTPGQTPQPSNNRSRLQGRARRIVESETSSTISSVIEEEEDEDEEDQGPIRRGQRNRAQTRILNRANGSREPSGPPSSTSTDVSTDDLDEDTQALLQSQGWMLQHHGPDEMGEDDDSDGGRTTVGSTVGWDATAISNDRVRMGGSLTPTADRPRPNSTIRPPSRVGNPLRRQPSVLPTTNAHYEDGEADDDDSDLDQDGDINMAMNSLRNRRSRTQLRNAAAFTQFNNRYANRGISRANPTEADADDNSDHSQDGQHRPHFLPTINAPFKKYRQARS